MRCILRCRRERPNIRLTLIVEVPWFESLAGQFLFFLFFLFSIVLFTFHFSFSFYFFLFLFLYFVFSRFSSFPVVFALVLVLLALSRIVGDAAICDVVYHWQW